MKSKALAALAATLFCTQISSAMEPGKETARFGFLAALYAASQSVYDLIDQGLLIVSTEDTEGTKSTEEVLELEEERFEEDIREQKKEEEERGEDSHSSELKSEEESETITLELDDDEFEGIPLETLQALEEVEMGMFEEEEEVEMSLLVPSDRDELDGGLPAPSPSRKESISALLKKKKEEMDAGCYRQLLNECLQAAVHCEGSKAVMALLEYGTPLYSRQDCAYEESLPVIELLLEEGAEIGATNRNGETPLMVAVRCGCSASTKLLLEKGANEKAENKEGWIAASMKNTTKYINGYIVMHRSRMLYNPDPRLYWNFSHEMGRINEHMEAFRADQ